MGQLNRRTLLATALAGLGMVASATYAVTYADNRPDVMGSAVEPFPYQVPVGTSAFEVTVEASLFDGTPISDEPLIIHFQGTDVSVPMISGVAMYQIVCPPLTRGGHVYRWTVKPTKLHLGRTFSAYVFAV